MIYRRIFLLILLIPIALMTAPGAVFAQDGPPPGCRYVEKDSGFETDDVWQFTQTASPGFFDDAVARSGNRSAFVGIPADGDNLEVDSTVWQEMTLPEATSLTATLWERPQPGDEKDLGYLVVWDLATNESSILIYEPVAGTGWSQKSADLTPFAGRDILLVVGVKNDGAGEKAGLWVDDLHVIACGLTEDTPTPAATSAPTTTPTITPAPTLTVAPTNTSTPAATATATASPTAAILADTPTPTDSPTLTPSPQATLPPTLVIAPTAAPRGRLPDNTALPLLAAIFFSGLLAIVVVVFNLRR